MPPAPGQEEPIKRMTKIVNSLLARQDCAPFREPVDWRGLELFDYPEVIQKMMDLGTVKRRLERGQYSTAHMVAEDIRLVWNNCMSYNSDGSDFWLLAKSYSRRFEDRYRKVKQEFDVGEDWDEEEYMDEDPEPKTPSPSSKSSKPVTRKDDGSPAPSASTGGAPSLDVRARFGANIFLLSGVELGQVVTALELECPDVLESWGDNKVEINVDAIPPKVFARLSTFVNNKVGTKTHPEAPSIDDVSSRRKKRKT